jgi:hemerythrin
MWPNVASVGINAIDIDHANLDYMFQTVLQVTEEESFLKKLIPAFIAHMNHEEVIIEDREIQFPADHKNEHAWMKVVLRSLEKELAEGSINSRHFLHEVRSIFVLHVLDFDVNLYSL